jgi:hypothetical protein
MDQMDSEELSDCNVYILCKPTLWERHLQMWRVLSSGISRHEGEAICSSETLVEFQRTIRRYIPDDGTLHNRRCENLKTYT